MFTSRTLKAKNKILWEEQGGAPSLHQLARDHPPEESFELRPEETGQAESEEDHSSEREQHVQMS